MLLRAMKSLIVKNTEYNLGDFLNFSKSLKKYLIKKGIWHLEGTEKVPFGIKDLKNYLKTIF